MTIQDAAKEAIMVQSACNLSGVVRALAVDIMPAIREATDNTGAANRHPIVQVWTAKIADLCGLDYEWPREAYAEVERLAEAGESV